MILTGLRCQWPPQKRSGVQLGKHGLGNPTCPQVSQRRSNLSIKAQEIKSESAETDDSQEKEGYDVYLYEPQPLLEGQEKHTISVFVADESGLINRVAGVFARRGINIETLAVGLNLDKALFTIVLNGTPKVVSTLCRQLERLVKVRYVEDVTNHTRIEQELLLIKIRAPAGPARTEVLQLADIFRSKVVDVSERCLIIQCSGDPGKLLAFQKVMAKFGILEICRTGRVTLKRGESLMQVGGWGDCSDVRANVVQQSGTDQQGEESLQSRDGDVYSIDKNGSTGVWNVRNVLDVSTQTLATAGGLEPHTLSIEVQDYPGVLNEVTGVFARRGYNVQSLAVGTSEVLGRSRITMVVPADEQGIQNLLRQLYKLVAVQNVTDLTTVPYLHRELMLIKVRCTSTTRSELYDLTNIQKGNIVDVSLNTVTLQISGTELKMTNLQELLEPYGILEVARTGRVAMARDSGVDSKYLSGMRMTGPI